MGWLIIVGVVSGGTGGVALGGGTGAARRRGAAACCVDVFLRLFVFCSIWSGFVRPCPFFVCFRLSLFVFGCPCLPLCVFACFRLFLFVFVGVRGGASAGAAAPVRGRRRQCGAAFLMF